MTNPRVEKFLELVCGGDTYPQYIFLNEELMMPLPTGDFIYFPRYGTHAYLSKEDFAELLKEYEGRIFMAGNILKPR